jgi:hypothetical protein
MTKTPEKEWEETMTPEEVKFCYDEIWKRVGNEPCPDNFRAARLWKSSQRRRYWRCHERGCCGFADYVVKRWNPEKNSYDLYMIGFNFGH